MEQSDILKNNALLFFYYKIEPNKWNDDTWCKRVNELEYVLKKTGILEEKKD